jgi:hypothetical protein
MILKFACFSASLRLYR